jgi:HEAT repeat protein
MGFTDRIFGPDIGALLDQGRYEEVTRLAAGHERARARLIEQLASPNPRRIEQAARLLGEMNDIRALPALERVACRSSLDDERVRGYFNEREIPTGLVSEAHARNALAAAGVERCRDAEAVAAAERAILEIAGGPEDRLIAGLGDRDPEVREKCADALGSRPQTAQALARLGISGNSRDGTADAANTASNRVETARRSLSLTDPDDASWLRSNFIEFAGIAEFHRFIGAVVENADPWRRLGSRQHELMFWQEKLLSRFSDEYGVSFPVNLDSVYRVFGTDIREHGGNPGAVSTPDTNRFQMGGRSVSSREGAIAALVAASAHDASLRVRRKARLALMKIGVPAIGPLVAALGDSDARARFGAAYALYWLWDSNRTAASTVPEAFTGAIDAKDAAVVAGAYRFFVALGRAGTESTLVRGLSDYGHPEMAEDFLNCGNDDLAEAGRRWASTNGLQPTSRPGHHGGPRWGAGA